VQEQTEKMTGDQPDKLSSPEDVPPQDRDNSQSGGAAFGARMRIRWRWTLLVGFTVAATIAVLYFMILDIEREAWLESQTRQAEKDVERLTNELKLPMLGISAESEKVIDAFIANVQPLGVLLKYKNGTVRPFGDVGADADAVAKQISRTNIVTRLPIEGLWFENTVYYADTAVAVVAVRYSEETWERIAGRIGHKIFYAAIVVIMLSTIWVYWMAARMSKPLEMLAQGAQRIAGGDYQVRLPVEGNDEISDAVTNFNEMARELAHKEELRSVFGRYLNPKLVADVFNRGDIRMENHRQEVSVLFADMVQFTSFSESNESEEVVNVLNSHFEVFHRIIAYYGGHVDKYIGDAVMAVFNHPVGDPEHTRHALKAGLAIASACGRLAVPHQGGRPISFRIGLNFGQAIVGNIGAARRLEYTVIGDAVNVASRMSGLGDGGEVVMSRETFEQLGDGFDFRPIGEREVKGVSKVMEVGVVTAVSKHVLRNIEHVVELAFSVEMPDDMRQMVGDV